MTAIWRRPISLVNARVVAPHGGLPSSIRFGARIISIDERPGQNDVVIDVDGAFVLPGLINAHEHLELNHYGRQKTREAYRSAQEWIDDMRPRLRDDPVIRAGRSLPLGDRLFAGALKNLLAGVTTVGHHNPLYRELRVGFPIRVVRKYGWAHSFLLERAPVGARGEHGGCVVDRFRATPRNRPFIVHLAEGTDRTARAEFRRFFNLGCLAPHTVLVHGVGLRIRDWKVVVRRGAGLIWCPVSNQFLFGRTAPVGEFLRTLPASVDHIALGTDSRLTGGWDLLDELRAAVDHAPLEPAQLLAMVTTNPAVLLRLGQLGCLVRGGPADMTVVPLGCQDRACAPGRVDSSTHGQNPSATYSNVSTLVISRPPRWNHGRASSNGNAAASATSVANVAVSMKRTMRDQSSDVGGTTPLSSFPRRVTLDAAARTSRRHSLPSTAHAAPEGPRAGMRNRHRARFAVNAAVTQPT